MPGEASNYYSGNADGRIRRSGATRWWHRPVEHGRGSAPGGGGPPKRLLAVDLQLLRSKLLVAPVGQNIATRHAGEQGDQRETAVVESEISEQVRKRTQIHCSKTPFGVWCRLPAIEHNSERPPRGVDCSRRSDIFF